MILICTKNPLVDKWSEFAKTSSNSCDYSTKGKIMDTQKKTCIGGDINSQLMVTAAHRYCLGRRSYIVESCVDWLLAHWDEFGYKTKATIIRDTETALENHLAGTEMDEKQWRRLLAVITQMNDITLQ